MAGWNRLPMDEVLSRRPGDGASCAWESLAGEARLTWGNHFAGHSPFTYENTFGSLQALQELLLVTCSDEGQGVVMQRTPVSRVAHTGS